MFAVKFQRSCQTFFQSHPWLPAKNGFDTAEIRVVISDVNPLAVGRKSARNELPAAVDFHEQFSEVVQTDRALTAKIENLAVAGFVRRRQQQRLDCVVHISEIAELRAFP